MRKGKLLKRVLFYCPLCVDGGDKYSVFRQLEPAAERKPVGKSQLPSPPHSFPHFLSVDKVFSQKSISQAKTSMCGVLSSAKAVIGML